MRNDVKDISVIRSDIAVVGQDRLGLSPFGMLSQVFNQEILQRSQLMAGAYREVPLTLLEEEDGENAPSASELPELGGIETPGEYKALFYIDDTVYANWEKWARNFFGHVNPYTGLAMKDDPALVASVLGRFGWGELLHSLSSLGGIFLPDEAGRVYPTSRQAASPAVEFSVHARMTWPSLKGRRTGSLSSPERVFSKRITVPSRGSAKT